MITFYCWEICLPRHIPHDKLLFLFIYFWHFFHPFLALNKRGRRGTKADRKNNINLIYFCRWVSSIQYPCGWLFVHACVWLRCSGKVCNTFSPSRNPPHAHMCSFFRYRIFWKNIYSYRRRWAFLYAVCCIKMQLLLPEFYFSALYFSPSMHIYCIRQFIMEFFQVFIVLWAGPKWLR